MSDEAKWWLHVAELYEPEALPNPRESAEAALLAVPWLREPDVRAVLDALENAGLTICWQA